jgi:hypothetical protein
MVNPNALRSAAAAVVAACLVSMAPATLAETTPDPDFDLTRPTPDAGPTEVTVGILVVDIFEVIDAEQLFLADVAINVRWRDPRLTGRWDEVRTLPVDQVWRPRLGVVNRREVEAVFTEVAEISTDGTVLYRQRLTGRFTARFDLHSFT